MEDTIDRIIYTATGDAILHAIEEEDKNGKWNDNYNVRDGFYVIHKNSIHYVYKVKWIEREVKNVYNIELAVEWNY